MPAEAIPAVLAVIGLFGVAIAAIAYAQSTAKPPKN
jgi:hypothetical protein